MAPHYFDNSSHGFDLCLPWLRLWFSTLRPRQNGHHFANDIFKCIFLNENAWISLKISLKFVPKVRINNIPALVQIMAWRRPDNKPLSEPMMVSLLTHICVTRPQWVSDITWTYTENETRPKWDKMVQSNGTNGIFQQYFFFFCILKVPVWYFTDQFNSTFNKE